MQMYSGRARNQWMVVNCRRRNRMERTLNCGTRWLQWSRRKTRSRTKWSTWKHSATTWTWCVGASPAAWNVDEILSYPQPASIALSNRSALTQYRILLMLSLVICSPKRECVFSSLSSSSWLSSINVSSVPTKRRLHAHCSLLKP